MKSPSTKTLKSRLLLVLEQQKQDHDKLLRTQKLLLDVIWHQGWVAYSIDQFGAYRFIDHTDKTKMRAFADALVEHQDDV